MKLVDFLLPKYGLIKGRDAIIILETVSKTPRIIEVICSVTTSSFNLSADLTNEVLHLKFIFKGVLLYKVLREDICGILTDEEFQMYVEANTESCVKEIKDSPLLEKNMKICGSANLHHIILRTYDFMIESLCENLIVEEISMLR